jgi:hypothetical protein
MIRIIVISVFQLIAVNIYSQNLPSSISNSIPKGYEVLDTKEGDLNLDGINDMLVVLKVIGEDTIELFGDSGYRPLLIFIVDANKKYTLVARNDSTVFCKTCGGAMGDPYVGMTIKNGYFSVEHYGGSGWRWERIITYKYDPSAKKWYLHKDGSVSFHAADPDKRKETIRTKKDFGQVSFDKYNIYQN